MSCAQAEQGQGDGGSVLAGAGLLELEPGELDAGPVLPKPTIKLDGVRVRAIARGGYLPIVTIISALAIPSYMCFKMHILVMVSDLVLFINIHFTNNIT